MVIFGFILNDNKNLKLEIKNKELIIVQLEGKIVDQETKILVLEQDNETKTQAIASLEEKARASSLAAQEAVDRMIELAKIEKNIMPAAPRPDFLEETGDMIKRRINQLPNKGESARTSSSSEKTEPNSAAEKETVNSKVDVINDSSSKKFINLRNDIYSRYK